MGQNDILMQTMTEEIILPILLEISKEVVQPIVSKVSIYYSGKLQTSEIRTSYDAANKEARGEVRVLLKGGGIAGSFNFVAESVFEGLSPGTGFSGFSVRGKVQIGDECVTTKRLVRTNRYNVWGWSKGFQF
jgi:hypothetical protein